jgi:hypothetical protein
MLSKVLIVDDSEALHPVSHELHGTYQEGLRNRTRKPISP